MNSLIKNSFHIADILAIPLFVLMVYYFYNIKNKNTTEYVLFLFAISGLMLDIVFTISFLSK
jgi:hypothetical protein